MTALPQALKGLKVIEVGGYAAGPWIGKVLANYGATVIHIESRDRPDGFRLQYPPYRDGVKGINRSGCFSYFNDSKYAVTLDIKKPGGRELAHKLERLGFDVVVCDPPRAAEEDEELRPRHQGRYELDLDVHPPREPDDPVVHLLCVLGRIST